MWAQPRCVVATKPILPLDVMFLALLTDQPPFAQLQQQALEMNFAKWIVQPATEQLSRLADKKMRKVSEV